MRARLRNSLGLMEYDDDYDNNDYDYDYDENNRKDADKSVNQDDLHTLKV